MEDIAPEYDVVVLGTGLTECVLSGVMSVKGKKVLHIDRNDHYGGESASINIESLFKKYGTYNKGEEPWKKYGRVNDWNIDLVPKLLMSNGELTNILVSTDVTRYLEFKQIAGSYVQQGNGPKATVAKVPSDASEALRSPLMGLFEKRRAKRFLEWVGTFKEDDPATYGGLNLNQCTMKEVYDKYGLEATTRDFIGHSMALYQTDEYMLQRGAAKETVQRIRLYVNSMARYGKSPYIYPLYGLGELPQGFARLSAIYGGTYMLNTSIDEVVYDGRKVSGIKATMRERGDESEGMKFETKTSMVIADPSYFQGKVQVVGNLLKAICILNHPVAHTDNSDSAQLIIPQSQVGRRNDIYIAIVSSAHNVCPKGYYIAIVSTIAEGSSNHHLELQPGFERLGKIEEKFMGPPIPLYEPLESGMNDKIFISKSYDATSHFETTTDDVRDIYRRAAGEELVVEGLREGTNLVDRLRATHLRLTSGTPELVTLTSFPESEGKYSSTTMGPPSEPLRKTPKIEKSTELETKPRLSAQSPTASIKSSVTVIERDDISSLIASDMVTFKILVKDMYLPDHKPGVFELLVSFLYRGSFPETAPPTQKEASQVQFASMDDLNASKVDQLLELHFTARDWNLPNLMNLSLDHIRRYVMTSKQTFRASQITNIYERIKDADDPLRRFLVDQFVFSVMRKSLPPNVRQSSLRNRIGIGNFVFDVIEAMINMKRYPAPVDPNTSGKCVYHRHRKGEKCPE
ncbi:MAG: hypothetical protein Q9213_003221 [Squamulea squamosa]